MKQDIVLTIRVNSEIDNIIRKLAKDDERTVAWMARKLIVEALEARGCLPNHNKT